jgi:CheY-like chemotaxis protein
MERFKRHALALIMAARQQTDFIATGTGRIVQRPISGPIFTHSALTLDGPDDAVEALRTERYRCAVVQNEIRNILLVDPHDICLALFTKAMKAVLPLANVSLARSSQEALEHMSSGKRFDIILVEERLKLFHGQSNNKKEKCNAGSELIRTLISLGVTGALFVGVSAHLDRDRDALERGGADLCWSKPPPLMDLGLRNSLLKSLLLKRGRATIAEELFG